MEFGIRYSSDEYDRSKLKDTVKMEYYEYTLWMIFKKALEWLNSEYALEMKNYNQVVDEFRVHHIEIYNVEQDTVIKRKIVFTQTTGAVVYLEEETIEKGIYRTIKVYKEA